MKGKVDPEEYTRVIAAKAVKAEANRVMSDDIVRISKVYQESLAVAKLKLEKALSGVNENDLMYIDGLGVEHLAFERQIDIAMDSEERSPDEQKQFIASIECEVQSLRENALNEYLVKEFKRSSYAKKEGL